MPDFDVASEPLHVFVLDGTYVFKHYFELNDIFDELADFYDGDAYRFEVPEREWDDAVAVLREFHFEPTVVEDVEDFVVVKEQYTKHAEILKHSIANWTRRGHHFFLMKDPLSVERAISDHEAIPVAETDLAVGI